MFYYFDCKKQLTCFFLFFYFSTFSQVKFVIVDKENIPINQAYVFLQSIVSEKNYFFGYTNIEGEFSYKLNNLGYFNIKISTLSYKTITNKIYIDQKNKTFRYVLEDEVYELNEVIIKDDGDGLEQVGDTLKYKIEKFLNGTEETLKDVIKKLPGLDIDSNGNIKAKGKNVDKFLIDGEDFFQNQQKLATENISAAMVKSIEFVNNYKEFKSLSDNSKEGVTAINIKIKDKFKDKIVGSLEAGLGNRFKIHSTIFNFSKKVLFNLISDSNNTGESSISIIDYENFVGKQDENEVETVNFVDYSKLPSFLTSGNKVSKRENYFTGLNLKIIPSKKFKIYLYSIFNKVDQLENQFRKQSIRTIFDEITNNEKINRTEETFLNNSFIETIYKPKENVVLNNDLNFSLSTTNNLTDIKNQNSNLINSKNNFGRINVENLTQYSILFKNKSLLNLKSTFNYSNIEDSKNIAATNPILDVNFIDSNYLIKQESNILKKAIYFDLNYFFAIKKFRFRASNNFGSLDNNISNQNLTFNRFNFENRFNNIFNRLSLEMKYNVLKKTLLKINFGYTIAKLSINNQNSKNMLFVPSIVLKHSFNDNHYFSIDYNVINSNPNIENLIYKEIINDYRTIVSKSNINYNDIFNTRNWALNYFFNNLESNTTIISNISHTLNRNFITSNSISNANFNLILYTLGQNQTKFNAFTFIEKGFAKAPFLLKLSLNYSKTATPTFINEQSVQTQAASKSFLFIFQSRFKKSAFQFETGYAFSQDNYLTGELSNNLNASSAFLDCNTTFFKNFSFGTNLSYKTFKTDSSSNDLYFLSPKIRYVMPKSKFEFSLIGFNLLNLNVNQELKLSNFNNIIEETTFNILEGYLLLNTKFKF